MITENTIIIVIIIIIDLIIGLFFFLKPNRRAVKLLCMDGFMEGDSTFSALWSLYIFVLFYA